MTDKELIRQFKSQTNAEVRATVSGATGLFQERARQAAGIAGRDLRDPGSLGPIDDKRLMELEQEQAAAQAAEYDAIIEQLAIQEARANQEGKLNEILGAAARAEVIEQQLLLGVASSLPPVGVAIGLAGASDASLPTETRVLHGIGAGLSVLPLLGVGGGLLDDAARGGTAGEGGLVHLTTPSRAARIADEGVLRGPAGIYAGPASNAEATGLGIPWRTGLMPNQVGAVVRIPSSAAGAFSRPIPIGPATTWQNLTGQRFTAAGNLDLRTGEFVRTGVNWNQTIFYAIDATFVGAVVTGGVLYAEDN